MDGSKQIFMPPTFEDSLPEMRQETYKTIGDIALDLWLFLPQDHTPGDRRPAIVFFHGGGWMRGHPSQFYKHCEYLTARGMVAITAAYRLYETHGSTVTQSLADAGSAVRYVRTHAEEWGIDPDRLVIGGSSAGGHLAAAVAIIDDYTDSDDDLSVDVRPSAMVLFNPVLVLASVEGKLDIADFTDHMTSTLGMPFDHLLGAPLEALSPYHHVSAGMGPSLIFHGTADNIVPCFTAELFYDKTKSLGNPCELITYEGAEHGFANYRRHDNAPYVHTVNEMDRFLTAHGYLHELPEVSRHV